MSRSGSRDEREQANEAPEPGSLVLSQGRSGGATSASDEAKEQPGPRSDRQLTAESRPLSIVVPAREQPTALIRSRDLVFVRNRGYRISSAEREMMTEIGKFRTIAVADLARHRYPNEPGKLRQDLLNLKGQKLIRQRRVMAGKGQEKLSVLVLTRDGQAPRPARISGRPGTEVLCGTREAPGSRARCCHLPHVPSRSR